MNPTFLGQLAKYCKEVLALESVSITDGSKVTRAWLQQYSQYIDIMAVSCDSFDEVTNVKIGRGKGMHVVKVRQLSEWCREFGVMFKINTVVCRHNWREDMNRHIQEINPMR